MSFNYSYSYNNSLSSAEQGQLASTYTSAMSSFVQAGADYVAYLAFTGGLSVESALELKAAVEAGNFTLDGLFGAAQSKTGAVAGAAIADPTPTLSVMVGEVLVSLDLTSMLGELDTHTWSTVTKKETIFHTREFYSQGEVPEYDLDWAVIEEEPEPVLTSATVEWTVTGGGTGKIEVTTDATITSLVITGRGDYDWNVEGFDLTGDGTATYRGLNGSNAAGNSGPENSSFPFQTPTIVVDYDEANLTDGFFDYSVDLTNQTNNYSSVTFVLSYEYWI